jgi:MarR family transcriptional regulator, lower aerobic nicotinate degradation pathway regulator
MPPKKRDQTGAAAQGLATVAPLASRWMERLLARHDPPLTVAQYLALQAVGGGDASGAELAKRTGVSGPAVSQLLAALVDAGLVEREASAEDRRRQTLSLSAAGAQVLDGAQTMLREQFATLLAGIPRPEVDALARLLPFVESALAGTAPPRRPPPPRPPHRPHGPGRPPRPDR